MTFPTWIGNTSKKVSDLPIFNLELAFKLSPESATVHGRRQLLVAEALKSIADRDPRLATWRVSQVEADGWVNTWAVIRAEQSSEAVALSKKWMASVIAAANLAQDPAAARLPDQRSESTGPGEIKILAGATLAANTGSGPGR